MATALMNWEGDYDSYKSESHLIFKFDGGQQYESDDFRITPTGYIPNPESGEWVTLQLDGIPASRMEWWDDGAFTTHTITIEISATITITFQDDTFIKKTGATTVEINIDVAENTVFLNYIKITPAKMEVDNSIM